MLNADFRNVCVCICKHGTFETGTYTLNMVYNGRRYMSLVLAGSWFPEERLVLAGNSKLSYLALNT